jgi:hypothetical protein
MRRAGMDLRREAAQGASRIRAGFLAGETGVPTALSPGVPAPHLPPREQVPVLIDERHGSEPPPPSPAPID